MPSRSWMAVLAVAAVTIAPANSMRSAAAEDADPAAASHVSLELQINGLSAGDSTIEIKPGHPGCQFDPVKRLVRADRGRQHGPSATHHHRRP